MGRLVYDFWANDIPTEVALETLRKLGIPFKVKVERRTRDPSTPEDLGKHDEWAKVYVDDKALVEWLKKRIDDSIMGF